MGVTDLVNIAPYDPESAPPPEVVDVLERGLVEITRRVEIYQADAETRWNPSAPETEVIRLIEGNVSVDYASDERRKLDLVLENIDQKLRPNSRGGLWYDKVIKVFRGVRFAAGDAKAPLAIIEATNANRTNQTLASMGYDTNTLALDADDVADLRDFQFIVSALETGATAKSALLKQMFERGKNVLTIGSGSTVAELPHYASTPAGSFQFGIAPTGRDNPVAGAFTTEAAGGPVAGTRPTGTAVGAQALAVYPTTANPTMVTAAIVRNGNGGMWIDIHLPTVYGAQARNLLRAALDYMRFIEPYREWETQLGEFYIDGINASDFPDQTKITARDGTKKLITDKLPATSTWAADKKLKDLIVEQCSNAGIPVSKMRLNIGDETLGKEMTFERGTSRWDIIKSALESFKYERFFDGFGNFVVRRFLDPSTSPVAWTFGTGPDGNLVQFEKSVNDSRIYNHVIVTCDPSTEEGGNPIGYFGEAKVTDTSAPTHRDRIGNRVLPLDAPWITSDAEAHELAVDKLKITALESYELSFSSIYYPWLECGEIVKILDPDALDFEPDRFLLDSITYPLALGPMSATGKRVTFIGSSGSPDEIIEAA